MDERMEREPGQTGEASEFTEEEISQVHSRRSGASLHTRVMEELMKQKQSEIQQQRSKTRNEKVRSTEAALQINSSRSVKVILITLGIMVVLILGLIVSQIQMNSRYRKIIESISQHDVPANGSGIQQDTRIAALENKLAQIEEKVDTVIDQFDWDNVSISDGPVAPSNNTTSTPSADGKYMRYTVQKGDTLWSLSVKFFGNGQKSDELMKINGFTSPTDLKSGQNILVPSKK